MNSTQQARSANIANQRIGRARISATLDALVQHPEFQDAVEGIKMLYSWDFDAMIERPAFDVEVGRAINIANRYAESFGVERSHEIWSDTALCDGDVIRHLMHRANVIGDWAFLPAMRVAQAAH